MLASEGSAPASPVSMLHLPAWPLAAVAQVVPIKVDISSANVFMSLLPTEVELLNRLLNLYYTYTGVQARLCLCLARGVGWRRCQVCLLYTSPSPRDS